MKQLKSINEDNIPYWHFEFIDSEREALEEFKRAPNVENLYLIMVFYGSAFLEYINNGLISRNHIILNHVLKILNESPIVNEVLAECLKEYFLTSNSETEEEYRSSLDSPYLNYSEYIVLANLIINTILNRKFESIENVLDEFYRIS